MVGEGVVDAAAVYVEVLTQMLHGNSGALNVPAGISDAPGRVPFQRLILELRLGEPENEVVLVAFVGVLLNALTDADVKIIGIKVVENVVFFKLRSVKIHISAREICVSGIHESGNDLDVFVDAVGGGLDDVGGFDVELCTVGEESVGVEFGDIHNGLVLTLCALEHLILALVGVTGEMANVCDVHNAFYVIADIAQVLFEDVLHDIRAQIADMCVMIYRRAAGVHLYDVGMIGDEVLLFTACGVIKLHVESPF